MGLDINGMVASGLELAYGLAEDVLEKVTYQHATGQAYDPNTGTSTPTLETATPEVIVSTYKAREIDKDKIKVGDVRMVVKSALMAGITAKRLDDTVLRADGSLWQVQDFTLDPTGQAYTFQLRRVT